jgi:hypothetical protein
MRKTPNGGVWCIPGRNTPKRGKNTPKTGIHQRIHRVFQVVYLTPCIPSEICAVWGPRPLRARPRAPCKKNGCPASLPLRLREGQPPRRVSSFHVLAYLLHWPCRGRYRGSERPFSSRCCEICGQQLLLQSHTTHPTVSPQAAQRQRPVPARGAPKRVEGDGGYRRTRRRGKKRASQSSGVAGGTRADRR